MTLCHLRGHSLLQSFSNAIFRTAVTVLCSIDKISTDEVRRAVPLRQLSYLSHYLLHLYSVINDYFTDW